MSEFLLLNKVGTIIAASIFIIDSTCQIFYGGSSHGVNQDIRLVNIIVTAVKLSYLQIYNYIQIILTSEV